jgi:aspartyl-tRNA(Asn)/glutamyl-tRNA(Gln) amidotransferase subunit C
MDLTKQEIEHIAKLARLGLNDEELKMYGTQLAGILNFVGELQGVKTDDIEPTAQVTGLVDVFREDLAVDWDKDEIKTAIGQAPGLESGQVKVKRILE